MSPNSYARGQHHQRLAWVTTGGLGVALVAAIAGTAMPRGEDLWHLITAPKVDGEWKVLSIDDVNVNDAGYMVRVRWSKIVGWHDGCNDCGFADFDEPGGGVICTLRACTERPTDRLFRLWLNGDPDMKLIGSRLNLSVPGHHAELDHANTAG